MYKHSKQTSLQFESIEKLITIWICVGLFIQLSGNIWLPSGSSHATQINLWLMLPTILFLFLKIKNIRALVKSKEELLILFFIVWFMISSVWSTSNDPDVIEVYIKHGLYVLLYLSAISIIYLNHPDYLSLTIDAAMIVAAIGALLTFYFQISTTDFNLSFRSYRIHEMGIGEFAKFSHPIQAANYFGAFSVLAFARVFSKKKITKAICFLLLSCIFISYVYLTGSRGPLAAVLFALVICLATIKPKLFILACFASIILIAILINLTSNIPPLTYSSTSLDSFLAAITSNRWFVWAQALNDTLLHSPFIGFGADASMAYYNPAINFTYYHPHSGFVLITYETGLIGLVLYCLAMTSLLSVAYLAFDKQLILCSIALIAFCFIAMITDVHKVVNRPHDYWVFIWLPVGIICSASRQKKYTNGSS